MENKKFDYKKIVNIKTITATILLVLALVSIFVLSDIASSPQTHSSSIEYLDEKKLTVTELTAASAVSSVAVSLVPGDATSAIANQIANLSSYLLIIVGAIVLEKVLLTLTGYASFTFLFPAACVLGIIYIFYPKKSFKTLALKLAAFGSAIFLIIPLSVKVSAVIEDTFKIQEAASVVEEIAPETDNKTEENKEEKKEGIVGWFQSVSNTIGDAVSNAVDSTEQAVEKAKELLNHFIDTIAVLLITSCVIPILVFVVFWLLIKIIFGIETPEINPAKLKKYLKPNNKAKKSGICIEE